MSDLKLVVFDCDGTLVDSQQIIVDIMQATFESFGVARPEPVAVKELIGLTLEKTVLQLVPGLSVQQSNDIAERYRDIFHQRRRAGAITEPLYPHVVETIKHLDAVGCVLGIATGKGIKGLHHMLETHGLASYFTTLQTPDSAPGKPHPGMLENAMADTGARPVDTVLVGDTTFDMEMAGNAGVRAIGVDWGYHRPNALSAAGADVIISSLTALNALGR